MSNVVIPLLLAHYASPAAAGCSPCGGGGEVLGPEICVAIAEQMAENPTPCADVTAVSIGSAPWGAQGCSCGSCLPCPRGQSVRGVFSEIPDTEFDCQPGNNYDNSPSRISAWCFSDSGVGVNFGFETEMFEQENCKCEDIPCMVEMGGKADFDSQIPVYDKVPGTTISQQVSCGYVLMDIYEDITVDLATSSDSNEDTPVLQSARCDVAVAKLVQDYPPCAARRRARLFSEGSEPLPRVARPAGAAVAVAAVAAASLVVVAIVQRARRAAAPPVQPLVGLGADSEDITDGPGACQ